MINGIHHTAISTPDIDRIVRFYTDIVGFEIVSEFAWEKNELIDEIIGLKGSKARTIMLKAGNTYLEFFQYAAPTPKPGDPHRPPSDHGYTHICLDVSDIDTEYERLTKAGMTFNRVPPPKIGGMSVRAVYGRDLDGNVVEIQETLSRDCPFELNNLPKLKAEAV